MIAQDLAPEPALVDVIDRLLARGVVVRGDLWLTVADVELVYVGAQLVIASPETIRAAHAPAPRADAAP